jgi:hypothetical protein
VAEIHPDLVVRDENGKIYTVRYDAVNAMLLNEFRAATKRLRGDDRTAAKENGSCYRASRRAGDANSEGECPVGSQEASAESSSQ